MDESQQPPPRRLRLSAQDRFIDWFQSVAPYIHAFRGRTFVIAFGGDLVTDGRFIDLTVDLNLLASLGVRLEAKRHKRAFSDGWRARTSPCRDATEAKRHKRAFSDGWRARTSPRRDARRLSDINGILRRLESTDQPPPRR